MENLRTALIAQIQDHQWHPDLPPITQFRAQLAQPLSLLAWLKAQHFYPQFYLNLRDEPRQIAAVGKVRCFFEPISAQQFLSEHQDLRLVGGLTFAKQAQFWLPRLCLESSENGVVVCLNVDNQQNIEQEKAAALAALETLEKFTALEPIQHSVRLSAKKADQATWQHWVEQALKQIEQQHFTKVVLANESQFEAAASINAKDFLAESEKQNGGCYHFLYAENAEQTFVGSTPERLYARNGTQVRTEALAGTAMVGEDEVQNQQQADWLLNDPKNDHENLLVVQDICNNLAPYIQRIEVDNVEVKRLRRVQHLRRGIQLALKAEFSDAACLGAIHPTAAVSGLPQQSAVQFLQKTENFDRSWYAGTLGFLSAERAEFCVTIRSAFIEQNKIRVFAGAGIVAGSVPLLEWQEIERKASGLISLLSVE